MTDSLLAIIASLPQRGKSVLLIEHDLVKLSCICHRVIFMDARPRTSARAHPKTFATIRAS